MSKFGDTLRGSLLVASLLGISFPAFAEEEAVQEEAVQEEAVQEEDPSVESLPVEQSKDSIAREALQQKETDVTQEKNLEEVFQATEKQYSLLRAGKMGLNFNGNYSFFRDDRIDIVVDGGQISQFLIQNDSQHSFGASLSFDYGLFDNLTLNTSLPAVYKYDTQQDTSQAALGDVSFGLRFQPFPVKVGATNATLYATLSTASGDSPYEIIVSNELAGGKGYYSIGGGVSMSKVVDPVVLFGSVGYTHAFDATGLNQRRGSRVLTEVETGDSLNFSLGLAYSLSYEVSLSASYQQSYNFQTNFVFDNGDLIPSEDSASSIVNMSLGLRTSKNRVINVSFGYGLTEDSPDVLLGLSVPIEISGLKSGV